MKVAAIIVTYNAMQWIERCLTSLSHSKAELDLIVIDNSSTDNTCLFIKEHFPKVELIENEENLGFGQANNVGIAKALKNKADYFFLLNQDAWIENNTISILVETLKNNPDYGIVSPVHLNGAGTLIDFGFYNCITRTKAEYDERQLFSDLLKKELKAIYQFKFVNAAAWLVSKKCIETVGGFDPLFYHYGEDNNYCQRIKFHGFKLGVVPNTFICHDREQRMADKSKNGLKQQELAMMKTISDINLRSSFDYRFKQWKKIIKQKMFSSLLSLDFKEYKVQKKLYKKLIASKVSIRKSLETNRVKGLHWIKNAQY